MDLSTEKWLPVLFSDGEKTKVALCDILDNRIQDLAFPRADFQGAAWQMLIGILQCTIAPEDKEEWGDVWNEGIEPERWQRALRASLPLCSSANESLPFYKVTIPLIQNIAPLPGC
jgi:CRISPR system Cascade subunit CasA